MPQRLQLRAMTAEEFERFCERTIAEYAAEHVRSGDWSAQAAPRLAAQETASLLPHGRDTAGMLLLCAEHPSDGVVGTAWVALEHGEKRGAWIYEIDIQPEHRGNGYGRELLSVLERTVLEHGIEELGLNVFAGNAVARGLYESSGYETTSLHMRKRLGESAERHARSAADQRAGAE
ncbi:MAG: GNAT family N-acetyltransferase [Solirubrobacterales bacterium]|nr:GNAT family N-acetyltransferase [Solirubrobacterales bacterium]